jgi:hypothetical protein
MPTREAWISPKRLGLYGAFWGGYEKHAQRKLAFSPNLNRRQAMRLFRFHKGAYEEWTKDSVWAPAEKPDMRECLIVLPTDEEHDELLERVDHFGERMENEIKNGRYFIEES